MKGEYKLSTKISKPHKSGEIFAGIAMKNKEKTPFSPCEMLL